MKKKYFDEVWRDVVPMDVCHVLLGRPWQYDHQTIHDGKKNTYSLCKGNQQYTLLPMKEKVSSKPQSILMFSLKNCLASCLHE